MRSLVVIIVIALFAFCSSAAFAVDEFCDVYVNHSKIFSVSNTRLLPALERGQRVNDAIQSVVDDPDTNPSEFSVRTGLDGVPVIYLDDKVICSVTIADADEAGTTQEALAQEWCDRLIKAVEKARLDKGNQGQTQSSQSVSAAGKDATNPDASGKDATGKSAGGEKPKEKKGGSGLSEHAVLLLFVEIALLLFTSLVCGELMVRLGQPAIIGQILAGLLLGPTFLGALFPDISFQLFPRDGSQSRLIEVISWIGVSFLLMLTGMETDIAMLKRLGKPLLYFGVIGLVGPLVAGGLISMLISGQLMGDLQNKLSFAVFLGTVFAASSVPVVAKVLMDMKMLKLSIGQLIIATSLAHDLLCCLLLAIIVVLSGSEHQEGNPVLVAICGTICFLAVMYFGRPVFFAVLRWINDRVSTSDGLITAMVVLLLSCAAATQALGVHIVLGAFSAGVILS